MPCKWCLGDGPALAEDGPSSRSPRWLAPDPEGTCKLGLLSEHVLMPNELPPNTDGFIPPPLPPLLIQGTPSTGNGSSGGVTCMRVIERAQEEQNIRKYSRNNAFIPQQLIVTSRPMLPLSAILMGLLWLVACIRVVKWLMPISSNDDFRLPVDWPMFGSPCRSELDRRSKISLSIYIDQQRMIKREEEVKEEETQI